MLMPLFISTSIVTDNLLKGEIISEGDIATAFCSSCFTEVTIRYEYLHFRSFRSESGDLMMRGLILAAAEDAFSHSSNRRRQAISAIVASLT